MASHFLPPAFEIYLKLERHGNKFVTCSLLDKEMSILYCSCLWFAEPEAKLTRGFPESCQEDKLSPSFQVPVGWGGGTAKAS